MNSLQKNISLRNKTTFRIGGLAKYFVDVTNLNELIQSVEFAFENDIQFFLLGNGSNLLISDNTWNGLVIRTVGLNKISWDGLTVEVQSGVLLQNLVSQSVNNGFSGMELLAGIPGTLGGALIMNAGAFGQEIKDLVDSVDVLNLETFKLQRLFRDDVSFGYRTSSLKMSNSIVVSAKFNMLKSKPPDLLLEDYKNIIIKRKNKQPLNKPNCGSVFKRPLGSFAGTLIEECGLKGFVKGGAEVSLKHGNFIVNNGNATASDVRFIIAHIQKTVYNQKKILLEPEVIFLGDFDIPLFSIN